MKLARLKEWRESHGLTQKELAAEAHASEWTVARAEAGEEVRPNTARRLAEAIGITVADLLESPPVLSGKAEAPQESGQQERRARITAVRPTGRGPTVTREMLGEELGITVTDAELNSINIYLENLWHQRGEGGGPVAIVSLKKDNVDLSRVSEVADKVDALLLHWLAEEKFTPEQKKIVREHARGRAIEKLATSTGG